MVRFRSKRVFSSRRPGSGRTFSLVAVFFIFALVLAPPIQNYFTQRAQINSLRAQVDSDRAALEAARPLVAAGIGEGDAPLLDAEDPLELQLRALAETNGWKAGDLFMALRAAATGRTATPPLFDSMRLLGQTAVLARIDQAIALLRAA